ncbi:putative leader peptide [Streptomyces radicis]|nr:putative leader peptide [Streptomyces radicis]
MKASTHRAPARLVGLVGTRRRHIDLARVASTLCSA